MADSIMVLNLANTPELCLVQQGSTHSDNNFLACKVSEAPEAEEKKEQLPKSFDELAARLDQQFGRLEVEVEQMVEGLREAQLHSEQIRHQLLDGGVLQGNHGHVG